MTAVCKRKLFLSLAVAAAVVLAGILAITQFGSSAPVPPGSTTCSVATLDGTYVWSAHGEVQSTGGNKGPFAVAGIDVFDGCGYMHGFLSRSTNGKISRRVSFTATYTLNPDCTRTATATDATGAVTHYDHHSFPSGSRLTFLQTDPRVMSSGVDVRKVG